LVNLNPARWAWGQPAPKSRIEPKEQTLVAPDQPDRTVLPPPQAPFKGKIETYLMNSTQSWPQPLKAPKGAPNVLLIFGDDIGFGGPANTPVFDRVAKSGLRYTNF